MVTAYLGETGVNEIGDFKDWWAYLFPLTAPIQAVSTAQDFVKTHSAGPVAKNTVPVKADPLITYVYGQANKIHDMLTDRGIPEPAASYGTYQSYHETNAYHSDLYTKHNNGSGINFAGQPGAVKGTNGYAWWPGGLDGWADAFKHELSKGANPAGATTLEDFVARLKKNGYFTDSVSNYLSGMKRARLVLKVIPAADRASVQADGSVQDPQDMNIPGTVDHSKTSNKWADLPEWEKGAAIAAGFLILLVAVKN